MACVKLDRRLTRPVWSQEAAGKGVSTLIGLSYGLGMSVVAEGVENAEQLRFLREAGCDEVQGFYLSEALLAPEFKAYAATLSASPKHKPTKKRGRQEAAGDKRDDILIPGERNKMRGRETDGPSARLPPVDAGRFAAVGL